MTVQVSGGTPSQRQRAARVGLSRAAAPAAAVGRWHAVEACVTEHLVTGRGDGPVMGLPGHGQRVRSGCGTYWSSAPD